MHDYFGICVIFGGELAKESITHRMILFVPSSELKEADEVAQLVACLRSPILDIQTSACYSLAAKARQVSLANLAKAGVFKGLVRLLKPPALRSHAATALAGLLCPGEGDSWPVPVPCAAREGSERMASRTRVYALVSKPVSSE
jgi:hypothetical protein